MDTLPVAVIGCGLFGQIHAEAYARFEAADLHVVCDLDEPRARETAQRFGCDHTTDIDQVLGDETIKAVSIVTPDFTHRAPCLAAAEAGKHLLVEKPLATTTEDARAIVQAVHKAGVIGGVDFHNRYHPAFHRLKSRLTDGRLGDPRMLFARLSDRIEVATQWFKWSGQSGPEWFLGPHLVDLALWLFDQPPGRVYAQAVRGVLADRGIDCNDAMHLQLTFEGGGIATLETSWIVPDTWPTVADMSMSLQTTTSRVDIDTSRQGMTEADGDDYQWPFLNGQTAIGDDRFGYFALPIHDFVRRVLRGEPAPTPVAAAVDHVRIIEAALASAATGSPQTLSSG